MMFIKLGKLFIVLWVVFDDGSGFDLIEVGIKKLFVVYVVCDLQEVFGIVWFGFDLFVVDFMLDVFLVLLIGWWMQIKGLLCDQVVIVGIGNVYFDEILYVVCMLLYVIVGNFDGVDVEWLYDVMCIILIDVVVEVLGKLFVDFKDVKWCGMQVYVCCGEICLVCGDMICSVFFVDCFFEYCLICQMGGKVFVDCWFFCLFK